MSQIETILLMGIKSKITENIAMDCLNFWNGKETIISKKILKLFAGRPGRNGYVMTKRDRILEAKSFRVHCVQYQQMKCVRMEDRS